MTAQNALFTHDLTGKRVLVLVPHADDEVNVAGGILPAFAAMGADCYICYSTNGDFCFRAQTRIREAVAAAALLGTKPERIIFLGYGDTLNHTGHPHLYDADVPAAAPSGHTETYGAGGYTDYATQRRGHPSPYTRAAFRADVAAVVEEIRADIIICVDYDKHADHRMLSVIFDTVMGKLLTADAGYRPQVLKCLAYATAYESVPDFYAPNIRATRRPIVGELTDYPSDMLSLSYYVWEERIRFPVFEYETTGGRFLHGDVRCRALKQHRSQGAALHAEGILNGDAVYFQHRTDNLAYTASLWASSGDPAPAADGRYYDIADIDEEDAPFGECLWAPADGDDARSIAFTFPEETELRLIRIYGNIGTYGRITALRISCDGVCIGTHALPPRGRALTLTLDAPRRVREVCLTVVHAEGTHWGIAECAFFSSLWQTGVLPPFIKIESCGDFLYDYWASPAQTKLVLHAYRCGIAEAAPLDWQIDDGGGHSLLTEDGVLYLGAGDTEIRVRATLKDHPEIFDTVTIRRKSWGSFLWLMLRQQIERRFLRFIWRKKKKYLHLRWKYIKDI